MSGIRTEVLLDRSRGGSLADRSPVHLLWTLTTARWTGRVTLSPLDGSPVVVDMRDGEYGAVDETSADRDALMAVMGWEDGTYALDAEINEEAELNTFGAPLDLLYEGLETYGQVSNLVQRIKPRLTLYPVATQDTGWRLRALDHPQPLTDLIGACDGSARLASAMRHEYPDMAAKIKALYYAVETHLLYPSPQPLPGEVDLVYTNLRGDHPGEAPEAERRRVRQATVLLVPADEPPPSGEFSVVDEASDATEEVDEFADLYRASSRNQSSSSAELAQPSTIRKARRIKTQTELRVDRKQQMAQAEQRAQEQAIPVEPPQRAGTNPAVRAARPERRPSIDSSHAGARPSRRPSRETTPSAPRRAMTPTPARKRAESTMTGDSVAAQRSYDRGLKFMEGGEWAQALTEFSRATRQHPDRLSYHAAVLWASYKNVPSKVDTILEKLDALYAGIGDAVFDAERCRAETAACIARIYRDEGRMDDAKDAYAQALEHDPNWLDVQQELDALGASDDDGSGKKKPGLFSRLVKRR